MALQDIFQVQEQYIAHNQQHIPNYKPSFFSQHQINIFQVSTPRDSNNLHAGSLKQADTDLPLPTHQSMRQELKQATSCV